MQFETLDTTMRVFENAHDHAVLPGLWMVARLDGRNFTRLLREVHRFEAPFDVRFRDMMVETTRHLMSCGFNIVYGCTHSDEISLLFHPQEDSFGRVLRKLLSILAGEASAAFALQLGSVACFDARISQIPTQQRVVDYFRWRAEDAHRNALNAHCYWLLRAQGRSVRAADAQLAGQSVAAKNELLFQHGVNVNELPAWHKRGVGLVWESYEKAALNPKTGAAVTAQRRRLALIEELPAREAYATWIEQLLSRIEARDGAH
jgi:tRNA(His) 5'-end guanylyltransferase